MMAGTTTFQNAPCMPLTFASLPAELITRTLTFLPDLSSLINVARSSRQFYSLFAINEETLTTAVLHNRLDPSLLHDAVAVKESWRAQTDIWVASEFDAFMRRYAAREPSLLSRRWTLSEAVPVERFHDAIEALTKGLVKSSAAHLPAVSDACINDRSGAWEPSQQETLRIQRTFYHYQLYWNMLGRDDRGPYDLTDQTAFFANFVPWEIERLACVHFYLSEILIRPGRWIFHHLGRSKANMSHSVWISQCQLSRMECLVHEESC